ncbi:MAG: molecular chaperone HtpG [Lachnospiraceae bacterium]|nr:molecular chaperone HtpG [Lachnospiraceae bacterium]
MAKTGSLTINSENIFPIIKKWMYSDHDIFARELVSNGCDAITKLKKLDVIGQYSIPEGKDMEIRIVVDPENKKVSFSDTGLGMDADEVEEYITQIAFSGATAFLEKYKDKTNDDQIIGHFGLGFYSAFMVADEVHIDSLSYKEGAKAVHWECDGGTEYTMEDGDREEVGTTITLFLNEDSLEFCNEYRMREVLKKYCSFMPTPIFLVKEGADTQYDNIPADEVTDKDTVIEKYTEDAKYEEQEKDSKKEKVEISPKREMAKIVRREVPINDPNPLWAKHPSDCTKEEYLDFYRKVFMDYKEPLFWIHLNMDYPFNLKGILYFPKINMEYESIEGVIKLYNNQVFIADNIKEVIPEFLMLLKGVIDCPDLPLNVSRSALQNDGFVQKISDYISKKVADKLAGMCKTEKEEYEKYWDDISPFIKYGCLKDDKFCEKMTDYILFKDIDGKYMTLPECLELPDKKESEEATGEDGEKVEAEVVEDEKSSDKNKDKDKDKDKVRKTVYYVTDIQQQSQYINMFREQGMNAVVMTHNIDQPFINQLESKNEDIKFMRIDADITDSSKEESTKKEKKQNEKDAKTLTELFHEVAGNDKLTVKLEVLKNEGISSVLTVSEESRRMQDMMKMYSVGGMDMGMFGSEGETLVLNSRNELVKYLINHRDSEDAKLFAAQLYDLAVIANRPLSADAMTKFVARSNEIMLKLAEK